ncbi:MAG: PhoH family protein [Bacteroidota bacterium]
MIEKAIYLEGIDPVSLYGANNVLLEKIKSYFPKLKIIGRGQEIIVIGELNEITQFENKTEALISFYHRYNKLTLHDIEEVIEHDISIEKHRPPEGEDIIVFGNHGKVIKARTVNQQKLVKEYDANDLILALGPAGTGKTYTAIALAVRALRNKEVKRIILTRPAVEAGESLGFLPGDLKEKLDPYLQPLYDGLRDMIPPRRLATYLEDGTIEIAPLAFMRGRTLDNAFVILDEGQNATINQFKMFLTRMGKNAKFIVTGDITQIDLPTKVKSGMIMALEILRDIKGISTIEFDVRDVVRHPLVKKIIEAYENRRP